MNEAAAVAQPKVEVQTGTTDTRPATQTNPSAETSLAATLAAQAGPNGTHAEQALINLAAGANNNEPAITKDTAPTNTPVETNSLTSPGDQPKENTAATTDETKSDLTKPDVQTATNTNPEGKAHPENSRTDPVQSTDSTDAEANPQTTRVDAMAEMQRLINLGELSEPAAAALTTQLRKFWESQGLPPGTPVEISNKNFQFLVDFAREHPYEWTLDTVPPPDGMIPDGEQMGNGEQRDSQGREPQEPITMEEALVRFLKKVFDRVTALAQREG